MCLILSAHNGLEAEENVWQKSNLDCSPGDHGTQLPGGRPSVLLSWGPRSSQGSPSDGWTCKDGAFGGTRASRYGRLGSRSAASFLSQEQTIRPRFIFCCSIIGARFSGIQNLPSVRSPLFSERWR